MVNRRRWFETPWEFREALLFTALSIIAGFVFQYAASGRGVAIPLWPLNAIVLACFALLIFGAAIAWRNNAFVSWFGGIPMGLSLILALAALSFIGGMVPQEAVSDGSLTFRLRLNQMFSSWPFALIVVLFLINLGLSLTWKLIPFSFKNLQFIFFHAGFWIALSCGVLGSSDLQRLIIPVEEGRANNLAYPMEGNTPVRLPFSVFLHDFSLEEYAPQILLYDPEHDKLLMDKSQAIIEVRKGTTASWKGLDVVVLDFIPSALPGKDGTPQPSAHETAIPYAKVRISSENKTHDVWISTGSPFMKPDAAELGKFFLIMVPGSPKAFRSAVTIQDDNRHVQMANLEVNKPVSFNGWKIYQMGYDDKAGRWSRLSLIEVIRDPWLPAVYIGFFMIMAGNVLFFWNGIKRSGVAK
ncbi:MAG: cytochrome c biogenesis protein ResB [Chlorobiaceae bacterium]|jgi:hypothetical protein|nr:cytochrome c biogenesis protein ResB [Chlorobiaceae bacterium]